MEASKEGRAVEFERSESEDGSIVLSSYQGVDESAILPAASVLNITENVFVKRFLDLLRQDGLLQGSLIDRQSKV